MGVGRIYSIQGGGGQKGGKGYFQNSGGSWLKGGVKKFRGVWTLDEAMPLIPRTNICFQLNGVRLS